jgi:hypothetical protein
LMLIVYLLTHSSMILVGIGVLIIVSVIMEKRFLSFCMKQAGFLFTLGCGCMYFIDGFVCGLGVIHGIIARGRKNNR